MKLVLQKLVIGAGLLSSLVVCGPESLIQAGEWSGESLGATADRQMADIRVRHSPHSLNVLSSIEAAFAGGPQGPVDGYIPPERPGPTEDENQKSPCSELTLIGERSDAGRLRMTCASNQLCSALI